MLRTVNRVLTGRTGLVPPGLGGALRGVGLAPTPAVSLRVARPGRKG
ncbi:hypothetical protein PEM37_16690 [Streptomyces sp. AD681]|nr:hypothetical protein [Streptomyces sp. AD681]MDA5143155.1 hypothetical protein [Streptomyces sp. AD681]